MPDDLILSRVERVDHHGARAFLMRGSEQESRMPYKIEHLPVGELKAYERNARTHSKKQLKQIARSIERCGFTNPVLIDKANRIIAGHGRVGVAKLLGIADVPTIRLEHLSDDEVRALVIADNQLALKAGWDRNLLALELQGLLDIGFDVSLTGFDIGEVDLILEEEGEAHGAGSGERRRCDPRAWAEGGLEIRRALAPRQP